MHFSLSLANPWASDTFKTWFHRSWDISPVYVMEMQGVYYPSIFFNIECDWRYGNVDHRGFGFEISMCGVGVHWTVYDIRHANREDEKCFM